MAVRSTPARKRIGHVSVYEHHGGFWIYYCDGGRPVRRRVGESRALAEVEASLLNAKLTAASENLDIGSLAVAHALVPASVTSTPIDPNAVPITTIQALRRAFLDHHEVVLNSSLRTVSRYSAATLHLQTFSDQQQLPHALAVSVPRFIEHLRRVEVSPNGHARTAKRRLRDKGVCFILECCRSMYHFGRRQGLLPQEALNPFSTPGAGRLRIRDAKPIFVFTAEQELAFFRSVTPWAFALHFILAKTGLRPGELTHLLIEDVDLDGGWLTVRGKPELGWVTKTNRERRVPLAAELVAALREVIGHRKAGLVFLRATLSADRPPLLSGDRAELAQTALHRLQKLRADLGHLPGRHDEARVYARIWREAGAVPADRVRTSFIVAAKAAGLNATCPKSWRHTFATLLQEANVDVLVRQETLGHKPLSPELSALGMTGVYTHTAPELQRREIERALRLRPQSLALADNFVGTRSRGGPRRETLEPLMTRRSN